MRIAVIGVGRIGRIHAENLRALPEVEEVVLADVVPEVARSVADQLQVSAADDLSSLLASGLDGCVIASSTSAHAEQLETVMRAGVPAFCEKPVARDLAGAVTLAELERETGVPVQVGFQRRFDAGYRRVRDAVVGGELGTVHLLRAVTHDQAPPPAAYLAASGGIFRDCSIHDLDVVRFVTGQEAVTVSAAGGNKGERLFVEADDVDTAAAILTMADGTLVLLSATRYNGAGHDVRLEVTGSLGALAVGLDQSLALDSAEPGVTLTHGPRHWSFLDRFLPAYAAELEAFVAMIGGAASPCTVRDALQAQRLAEACDLSRRRGAPVRLQEIPDTR
ncbi:Gfo/Idh/MocA family protein [Arsenicicoccus bolidensis]|uniref:Gfo/Idh/MocA family oxidoreductase n=1 Tax=Arsenicicoccus bolidensis TaxID=229480 RepID=A0ABS9Q6B1_9MICO|nr:Gfo/Idh/MocA family oxidoreductase [Arsenicicoccus bolidensis]MCG7323414.1 Gfo/Idh/MocA family oxidoreductase [Arsenicicoccus bolidensis]